MRYRTGMMKWKLTGFFWTWASMSGCFRYVTVVQHSKARWVEVRAVTVCWENHVVRLYKNIYASIVRESVRLRLNSIHFCFNIQYGDLRSLYTFMGVQVVLHSDCLVRAIYRMFRSKSRWAIYWHEVLFTRACSCLRTFSHNWSFKLGRKLLFIENIQVVTVMSPTMIVIVNVIVMIVSGVLNLWLL